ncbi:2,3-diaminopropionate biosynthesis protein SbnB [Chitinophaga tropicalis]|uniref:2,3-diaminopropionate biosynthesis protein SbnB n=1 Tax=Chitinophaga tropicalis TaxID=2683588 RepID=A0A7K1UA66_9BACT|nr:2,3-diaminopropionate biosynthesis protein SbnB [Chitinophaga tropicalis]MVT11257.1 2,3-diaminopropionate biosynthesis protein SbnB [Chitinophaga tropicalis]
MLYLNADDISSIGFDWKELTGVISEAIIALDRNDYSQPIKPYLRYGDPKNRIIAMPAYLGGTLPMAGIKWIASFPDNIYKNKLRANSVTILNEPDSGVPLCVINTSLISAVRTAAVSGLMIVKYLEANISGRKLTIGINGFGPIGRMHLKMAAAILGNRIEKIFLHDIAGIDKEQVDPELRSLVEIASSWEEVYSDADIFMTCTVSAAPYIDKAPRNGSLQLNVSLRDYKVDMKDHMSAIVVDDWDEVCRQNTDIENMHKVKGLQKQDTLSIADVVCKDALRQYAAPSVVMFNPMGMAIFDIATGYYYYREAIARKTGSEMPD